MDAHRVYQYALVMVAHGHVADARDAEPGLLALVRVMAARNQPYSNPQLPYYPDYWRLLEVVGREQLGQDGEELALGREGQHFVPVQLLPLLEPRDQLVSNDLRDVAKLEMEPHDLGRVDAL